MERRSLVRLLGVVLALHLAAGALHGAPHSLVPVELAAWQWVFVAVVANLGPVLGFVLAWRYGRLRLGGAVFAASMAAALLFGVMHHYVLDNPDHVTQVTGAWSTEFRVSAATVSATDLLGVVAGAWVWFSAEN